MRIEHAMKRTLVTILSVTVLLVFSCTKGTDAPSPRPERELSVPEKLETELMEVLSHDWKGLFDTLSYFNSTLLSKGEFKGKAPDGVYYELRTTAGYTSGLQADFMVEDSTWVTVNGQTGPLELSLHALDTEIVIEKESRDSTSLRLSRIKAVCPDLFFLEDNHRAVLLYEGCRVGFITREEFENTDYSTGTYLVVHYDDDPRTFALYDNGFTDLLKISLPDVL